MGALGYLLSKKEQRAGSPEKPLSGLGALGYKNYWTLSLMRYLQTAPDRPRLEGWYCGPIKTSTLTDEICTDISAATSMTIEDIFVTLTQQGMISAREVTPPPLKPIPGQSIKFPKGRKNGLARKQLQRVQSGSSKKNEIEPPKGPFVPPTLYEIKWDRERVIDWLSRWEAKGYLKLRAEKLRWSPYVLTRKEKEQEEAKEGLQAAEAGTFGNPIKIPDGEQPSLEEVSGTAAPSDIFDYELVGDQGSKDETRRSKSRSPSVLEILAMQMGPPRKKMTRSRSSPGSTPRRNGVDQPRFTNCGGRQTLPTTPRAELVLERKLRSRQGMDDERALRAEEVGAMLFSDEVVSLVVGQDERRVGGAVTIVDLKREDVEEEMYDADAEGELEEAVEVLYID